MVFHWSDLWYSVGVICGEGTGGEGTGDGSLFPNLGTENRPLFPQRIDNGIRGTLNEHPEC